MHQLMVPHYKRVRGRLVYLGRQPVGPAVPARACGGDDPDTTAALGLKRLKNDRMNNPPEVFATQTGDTERHIYIYITNDARRHRY